MQEVGFFQRDPIFPGELKLWSVIFKHLFTHDIYAKFEASQWLEYYHPRPVLPGFPVETLVICQIFAVSNVWSINPFVLKVLSYYSFNFKIVKIQDLLSY